MRTKRGGFRPNKPKQGRPKVRLTVTAAAPVKVPTRIRLAVVSAPSRRAAAQFGWRLWGPFVPLEPLDAGLKRFLGA